MPKPIVLRVNSIWTFEGQADDFEYLNGKQLPSNAVYK